MPCSQPNTPSCAGYVQVISSKSEMSEKVQRNSRMPYRCHGGPERVAGVAPAWASGGQGICFLAAEMRTETVLTAGL